MPLLFSYGTLQQESVQLETLGRVRGRVLEISDQELALCDEYERPAQYVRVSARLSSGKEAWVYTSVAPASMRIANIDPQGEIATTLLWDAAAEVRPLYTQPLARSHCPHPATVLWEHAIFTSLLF
jgi:hypothetical protein